MLLNAVMLMFTFVPAVYQRLLDEVIRPFNSTAAVMFCCPSSGGIWFRDVPNTDRQYTVTVNAVIPLYRVSPTFSKYFTRHGFSFRRKGDALFSL